MLDKCLWVRLQSTSSFESALSPIKPNPGKSMHWWIITVVCICGALLIQYLCSSKILRMKQGISIKSMALRDVRSEGARLEEQGQDLKNQQTSLTQGIIRLRGELKSLVPRLKEMEVDIPDPDFPLSELQDDAQSEVLEE